MTRLRADLLLLAASVIWGLAFVFQKSAMDHMGPYGFIAARSLVAVAALLPFAWLESRRTPPVSLPALLPLGALAGACFFAGLALQQAGLITATVTNAGFLTALYVVLTPLGAWAWQRQPPRRVVWYAVALSTLGAWLLAGGGLHALERGDVLVALGAIFWALQMVITGALARHQRPFLLMLLQFAVMGAMSAVAVIAAAEPFATSMLRATAVPILYTGVLSSALTFTLMAWAMKYTGASEAAIIVSTESVFSALAGALLLGERLPVPAWLGAALMMGAVLLVSVERSAAPAAAARPPAGAARG